MDRFMYTLSRIYGHYGMRAQKYSLVDAAALPPRLRICWHLYRILLVVILVFAVMLFLQDMVIFWCAFAAGIVALYLKGLLEEKLDIGLIELRSKEREQENDRKPESHPL